MSSLEGPTKAFREFFMMCYHHPKSVTIRNENVTMLQKVTHGNIVSKFTFFSTEPLRNQGLRFFMCGNTQTVPKRYPIMPFSQ